MILKATWPILLQKLLFWDQKYAVLWVHVRIFFRPIAGYSFFQSCQRTCQLSNVISQLYFQQYGTIRHCNNRNIYPCVLTLKKWLDIFTFFHISDLHDAICIPQTCLSKGYFDSSIMHENFKRSLKSKKKIILFSKNLKLKIVQNFNCYFFTCK